MRKFRSYIINNAYDRFLLRISVNINEVECIFTEVAGNEEK